MLATGRLSKEEGARGSTEDGRKKETSAFSDGGNGGGGGGDGLCSLVSWSTARQKGTTNGVDWVDFRFLTDEEPLFPDEEVNDRTDLRAVGVVEAASTGVLFPE